MITKKTSPANSSPLFVPDFRSTGSNRDVDRLFNRELSPPPRFTTTYQVSRSARQSSTKIRNVWPSIRDEAALVGKFFRTSKVKSYNALYIHLLNLLISWTNVGVASHKLFSLKSNPIILSDNESKTGSC